MAIGAVLCLSSILFGYATAFPNNWLATIEGGRCATNFTNGCCNGSSTACIIRTSGMPSCYCDKGCHKRDDCCEDIEDIGCIADPTECADAGLNPGYCHGPYSSSCKTPQGCYCDWYCRLPFFCDCCHDVPNGCRRSNLLSIIQEQPVNPESTKETEKIERRLLHSLISSRNDQRLHYRLPTAQFNAKDMEVLERALAELSKEDH